MFEVSENHEKMLDSLNMGIPNRTVEESKVILHNFMNTISIAQRNLSDGRWTIEEFLLNTFTPICHYQFQQRIRKTRDVYPLPTFDGYWSMPNNLPEDLVLQDRQEETPARGRGRGRGVGRGAGRGSGRGVRRSVGQGAGTNQEQRQQAGRGVTRRTSLRLQRRSFIDLTSQMEQVSPHQELLAQEPPHRQPLAQGPPHHGLFLQAAPYWQPLAQEPPHHELLEQAPVQQEQLVQASMHWQPMEQAPPPQEPQQQPVPEQRQALEQALVTEERQQQPAPEHGQPLEQAFPTEEPLQQQPVPEHRQPLEQAPLLEELQQQRAPLDPLVLVDPIDSDDSDNSRPASPVPARINFEQDPLLYNECSRPGPCSICLINERDILFLPCNHAVICVECSNTMSRNTLLTCPICRAPIRQKIFINFS
ncbi:hypothetical protein KQX54_010354 [Cotesia glomerata]|uniref:RING-type domain-containing protein n=1 Tax=Cotesia glomerata TaxID=32391 RepID=A0AAV7IE67_COTGL|nr:hypothetical protein KQX54_010354 [Cotesia glomerata]